MADEPGTGTDKGSATAQEGEVDLGLGTAVGEGRQELGVKTAYPGQILGVYAI